MNISNEEQCIKHWEMKYPSTKGEWGKKDVPRVIESCFVQKPGEVMWIPPGHWHAVHTLGGERVEVMAGNEKKHLSTHWIAWCTPAHLRAPSVMQLILGHHHEGQLDHPISKTQKDQLVLQVMQPKFEE